MSGLLAHVPTEAELERLYYELARLGAPAVGSRRDWMYEPRDPEATLVLAAEMLRYDARLLSVLSQLIARHFRDFNPVTLRAHMRTMRWPQSLLVALDFARLASKDPELRYYCDYLQAGWPRLETSERFFLDAERPGSRIAQRKLGRNLAPYARWGFVGSERPVIDPLTKRSVGRYDAETRRRILDELIEQREEFSLADYLDAVDQSISRQHALLDLKRHPGIALHGHGRGARWRKRRTTASARSPRRGAGP